VSRDLEVLEMEAYVAALEASGKYRVIRRFESKESYCTEPPAGLHRGVFLDVETTGTNATSDQVIELAIVPFEFSDDGRVYRVGAAYSGLQDPRRPLSPFISQLTGLTDEELAGKQLDHAAIAELLEDVSLVVAHNAEFDRPFFEKALPELEPLPWACSVREVPWREFGVEGRKLEYIAYRCGVFFDGHRAEVDCQVGIHVLARDWGQGRTALGALLTSVERVSARLWAIGSPFESKDVLKARGYRFDGPRKAWYRDLSADNLESEKQWLSTAIYQDELRRRGRVRLKVGYVTARERYRLGGPEPTEDVWLSS
jgi:DNA polymerase-3 subunit epsilon